jgi:hypothetical protein
VSEPTNTAVAGATAVSVVSRGAATCARTIASWPDGGDHLSAGVLDRVRTESASNLVSCSAADEIAFAILFLPVSNILVTWKQSPSSSGRSLPSRRQIVALTATVSLESYTRYYCCSAAAVPPESDATTFPASSSTRSLIQG